MGLALWAWALTATVSADGGQDLLGRLYQCFREGTHTATQGRRTVDFGPSTEIYFFEQLGFAMQTQGNTPEMAWCGPWFVEPYVRAHSALHGGDSAAPVHGAHTPLSTGVHLAKEDRLIHLAARMGGVSHVSAHADLMRQALGTPPVARQLRRLGLDTCARGLLMQGAQVPDLYLFHRDLWHGHTLPAKSRALQVSAAQVEEARAQFVALVVDTVHESQQAILALQIERGMLLLGAAAHAVQDLQYHRGMTRQEKAGLTYIAHSNPDVPQGSVSQRLHRDAAAATSRLLATAFAALPTGACARAADLEDDHEALAPLIALIWPDNEPVSFAAMQAYYASSAPLAGGHEGAVVLATANVGRWPVQATLNDILAAL